jgi:hypothetical protein
MYIAQEIGKKSFDLVQNSIFLLASLAWYDLIKYLFKKLYNEEEDGLVSKLSYALIMTVVSVIILLSLDKVTDKVF